MQQTELSRNISHELRSPLARMRVAVELARRSAGDLPEFERLDLESERLDALVGQILSYNKLETDAEQQRAEIELADVLNEVRENVNYEYGAERVVVDQSAGSGIFVQGYRGALLSALENIVRNAVRHSPGNEAVSIVLTSTGDEITVAVEDKGPGVPEEDLGRIFDPFFRTRQSAEQDGNGGTGLGLAIARRAVQLHDGHIEARNGKDGGLVVSIRLPAG
jgi:signal transduction histidine kinase